MIHVPVEISANEKKLQKLDNRDKLFRAVELFILVVVVAVNVLLLVRMQDIIKQNQMDAVDARKNNFARQEEIKGYIKCILLLRYDNPQLTPQSPREEVSAALDRCATQ